MRMMKQQVYRGLAVLCLLICLILPSCAPAGQNKYSAYSMDYFDTVITIVGYADSQEDFDAVSKEILSQFGEYHRLYSIYHRFDGLENLCTVNELVDGAHHTVTVDRRIIDLLLYAREIYTLTGGVVNVAMGSVLSLWHSYRTLGMDDPEGASLPPMDSLRAAAAHSDI